MIGRLRNTGTPALTAWRRLRRTLRRAVARRSRLLAWGAIAGAFAAGAQFAPTADQPLSLVQVARSDLPAGHQLDSGDLQVASWPVAHVPDGAVAAPPGRVLTGPLRRGEPVTDARLAGPGLLRGLPAATRAVPIRLSDNAALDLVRPGDRIDVLVGAAPIEFGAGAAGSSGSTTGSASGSVVVAAALVLAVPGRGADSSNSADSTNGLFEGAGGVGSAGVGGTDGAVLVLAVDAAAARDLAGVSGRSLSIALRPA